MLDKHSFQKVLPAIAPQTQTNSNAAIVSGIIDTAGFNSATIAIALGALGAGVSGTVTMEHGNAANLSDTSAVAAGDLIGSPNFVQADQNSVKKVGYLPKSIGQKRYLRVTVTPAGNGAASLPIAAIAVLEDARQGPVS